MGGYLGAEEEGSEADGDGPRGARVLQGRFQKFPEQLIHQWAFLGRSSKTVGHPVVTAAAGCTKLGACKWSTLHRGVAGRPREGEGNIRAVWGGCELRRGQSERRVLVSFCGWRGDWTWSSPQGRGSWVVGTSQTRSNSAFDLDRGQR